MNENHESDSVGGSGPPNVGPGSGPEDQRGHCYRCGSETHLSLLNEVICKPRYLDSVITRLACHRCVQRASRNVTVIRKGQTVDGDGIQGH